MITKMAYIEDSGLSVKVSSFSYFKGGGKMIIQYIVTWHHTEIMENIFK